MKYLDGKLLIQDRNNKLTNKCEVVTKVKPTEEQLKDMEFGMKVVKNMKSNAIAIVKDGETLAPWMWSNIKNMGIKKCYRK